MPTDLPAPKNDELCQLLRAWAGAPGQDPPPFYEKLLGATLLVVIERSTTEGSSVLVVDRNGETFVAAFTGEGPLRAMVKDPAARVVHVSARELCREVAANGPDGLMLDPAGPVIFPVSREQCALLARGSVMDESGAPLNRTAEDFVIGRPIRRLPDPVPETLVAAVKQEGVKRAFWFWIKRPNETEPQLAIAILPPVQELCTKVGKALWASRATLVAANLPSHGNFVVLPCEGQLAEIVKVASELLYEDVG